MLDRTDSVLRRSQILARLKTSGGASEYAPLEIELVLVARRIRIRLRGGYLGGLGAAQPRDYEIAPKFVLHSFLGG
jgi:hypothetical protein